MRRPTVARLHPSGEVTASEGRGTAARAAWCRGSAGPPGLSDAHRARNKGDTCMASRRLFVVLTAGALISAACGGSAAQKEALKLQSQNVAANGGGAASGGGYSSGESGASA